MHVTSKAPIITCYSRNTLESARGGSPDPVLLRPRSWVFINILAQLLVLLACSSAPTRNHGAHGERDHRGHEEAAEGYRGIRTCPAIRNYNPFSIPYRPKPVWLQAWPRIFFLGAQKAGSTSLSELLYKHPQICAPDPGSKACPKFMFKEPHFFNQLWGLGIEYYLEQFHRSKSCQDVRKRMVIQQASYPVGAWQGGGAMDATPDYISKPGSMLRMWKMMPDEVKQQVRFLFVLREPISRDLAWYNHGGWLEAKKVMDLLHVRANRTYSRNELYDQYLQFNHRQGSRVANKGRYYSQLNRLWQLFPRAATLVLGFDYVLTNTSDALKRITSFLGVDPAPLAHITALPRRPYDHPDPPDRWKMELQDIHPADCVMLDDYYRNDTAALYELLAQPGGPPEEPTFRKFTAPPCGERRFMAEQGEASGTAGEGGSRSRMARAGSLGHDRKDA